MKELVLFPRTVWRSKSGTMVEHKHTNRELAERVGGPSPQRMSELVGRVACVFQAAPGGGHSLYEVTRVDAEGVWALPANG